MWGEGDGHIREALFRVLGLKPCPARVQAEAVSCFRKLCAEEGSARLGAAQLFSQARGPFGDFISEDPEACSENAPSEPNMYTDGSLRRPTLHQYSLGGFGILCRSRNLQLDALHHNEQNLAHIDERSGDVHLYAPLPGSRCSSTRTEVAGILLALFRPGPVHIASDSRSAVVTMQSILQKQPRMKPWNLHPNGDLWQLIAKFVPIRGAASIAIKWVKGHTVKDDVERGIISLADHLGNHIADQLADQGVDKHFDGLGSLGCFYASRRHAYLKVVH